ncbi:calcium-transporting ATPase PMC1 KNAG_0D03480 [Huiozyma naganishii CBS 8797]|uniref:Calcium-transporting ATPase n=1 Tax=Huiozyma naganishii (strain ATCC MYA-139 / BCRC 22969 / CBS 8797 / KCTC 17520 / NBRC 10181 / NCYC 3082 / Yp74L-3) TaxID=1071383 RepID=J7R5H2_HUIN7|nr:hypothetical protein KNAG_0D03480 [Kazachstania naganishii CBS 8797]CCK70095.1 hypothetical protein KNAG_0D03480 [Kazachstania naganishii CBS 8797]
MEHEEHNDHELTEGAGAFKLDTDQLAELHNPKSLLAFKKVFKNKEENLFKYLKTDLETGIKVPLNETEGTQNHRSTDRYRKYGDNRIPERLPKSFGKLIWEAFNDKTMLLLTAAAIVSFALGMYEYFYTPVEYDPEGNPIKKVDWIEGIAIMMAVVVVVFVGALNDYQKELQFTKLNKKKQNRQVIVIRNGHEVLISIHHILVGDIISLQTGDVIPADSILVRGECEADESSITGESDTIKKHDLKSCLEIFDKMTSTNAASQYGGTPLDIGYANSDGDKVPDCMLISGSKLLSGLGKAVVTSVGTNSIYGRTMMSLKVETDSTPLQERLSQLADSISVYGCVAAIILFSVLFIRFLLYVLLPNGRFHDLPRAEKGTKFMNIFITSVTVIVVAVPEGLPLAVTLALAFATTRMTKDGNLVRVLRACETMGSATAVCSDKTGTLTENIMSVVKGVFGSSRFDDSSDSDREVDTSSHEIFHKDAEFVSTELRDDVFANLILNSTAFENKDYRANSTDSPFNAEPQLDDVDSASGDDDDNSILMERVSKGREEPYIGSKTETALLNMARKSMDLKWGELQSLRDHPEENFNVAEIAQLIPFESSRKWSGVVVKYKDTGLYRLFAKGAAEMIFNECQSKRNSQVDESSGKYSEKLDDALRKTVNDEIQKLANNALRAISVAHRDFPGLKSWPPEQFVDENPEQAKPESLLSESLPSDAEGESGLVLDGFVGIMDPLRPDVRNSVLQCQDAGVTVRMVTGDNILTARAIAKNCNILSPKTFENPKHAMEGPKFRKLSHDERVNILPDLRVLARSSPEDKRLLVETLKGMGEVVAVTGDGTNDAPALKLADVGFSMGISGTEVAREASDIILMTDDFSAIVNAIKWGRCVSISIKKFIQFQLIVNCTAVTLTFVSSVASDDETSVLTAVQLLWVNLIMDTLAALALATDKPDPNIMTRKPRGRATPLITPSTWKMILGQALLQLIVTFTLHFHGQAIFFPGETEISGHQQQQLNAMTFNTFVWLQFFTLLVSRKLDECDGISYWKDRISQANLNFFQDLFRNYYFLVIMGIIGAFQTLIMFYGGTPFSIAPQTKQMWVTAVGCGLLSLPVGVLIRICPDEWAIRIFPAKLFLKLKYVVGLEFLRSTHKQDDDEEALLDNASSGSSAYF